MKCQLSDVKPAIQSGDWSLGALEFLHSFTHKPLEAEVRRLADDNSKMGVLLHDRSSQPSVCLNTELVERGLAHGSTST